MKYKFSIYIILAALLFIPMNYSLSEPVKARVLFVGNSLTFVNNLLEIIDNSGDALLNQYEFSK